MSEHSAPVKLAKESLEYYLTNHKIMASPEGVLPQELSEPAGAFVSLKKQGHLRGCIGTLQPTQSNAAEEIIRNAVSAGTGDPRFPAVNRAELDELDISVDILKVPERVGSFAELDCKRYGVIVRQGNRAGLLLPDLEGVDSVEEQVDIARQKAGIGPNEAIELQRFEVIRYR